ncbi:MAG: hypothetical protein MUF56_08785 [Solirubrobacteraceae bacterium]|nr:hypothetical protein [Solirubrobacteraceae bacterium]
MPGPRQTHPPRRDPQDMTTLTTPLTLGAPKVAGPLAVFPVFGPAPVLDYRAFSDAVEHGAFVKELEHGASVNRLLVGNPTGRALLLYEGEQVLGAQQDRTLDASVLVAAGAQLEVPVSCVEAGRWDDRRRDEHFRPAPHADDPSLRRAKREAADRNAARGLRERPEQSEVWQAVGARLDHFAVASPSAKFGDLFEQRAGHIDALADDIEPEAGQVGALACVGGEPVALDVVSRPDAFAALHDRLVRGYALDALAVRHPRGEVADPEVAGTFFARALGAARRPAATPGLGEAHALVDRRVVGSTLTHEGELIALCAFPGSGDDGAQGAGPVARPSRRRPR